MEVDCAFRDCQNLPDIDYCNRSSICCSSDPIFQASPILLPIAEANIAGRYPINRVSLVAATQVPQSYSTIIYNNNLARNNRSYSIWRETDEQINENDEKEIERRSICFSVMDRIRIKWRKKDEINIARDEINKS